MEGRKKSIQVEVRINPSLDSGIESTGTALTVGTKTYTFSRVHLTTTQMQLYNKSVKCLTELFMEGYNCTVIAYGQTGSGKTYTMGITHEDATGIVPQALKHIFRECSEVSCSFIEIYNEEVIDLFSKHKAALSLREVNGEVTVAGVSEEVLRSYEEGVEMLRRGSLERTTKSTNMNSKSSRSHAIFTVFCTSRTDGLVGTSRFSFVDLAGSERLKRTLCAGDRAREGISINSGLLALGNVISALFRRSSHVPFRDSKLTRILQSCLSGYVLMIACVSSSHADISETHNTLKYANRAASIETKVMKSVQVDSSRFVVQQLKKEIQKLRAENQILRDRARKNVHVDIEELISENRRLRSEVEAGHGRKDDRREDLAQEILKSPFVQNLLDENQRLQEEIQSLRLNKVDDCTDVQAEDAEPDESNSSEYTGIFGAQNILNEGNLLQSGSVSKVSDSVKASDAGDGPSNKSPRLLVNREFRNRGDEERHRESGGSRKKQDTSPVAAIAKCVDSLEISSAVEVEDVGERPKPVGTHKRVVTFDLEKGIKKYALFTPRKEKITMRTVVKDRLVGYLPTALAFFNSSLVFASIDNKVRQWREEVSVLFTEDGVRCLESGEALMYTTRGLLKSFDHRSGPRPVHAFRSEISSLAIRDNYIYTGHEDGSLSIFDMRGSSVVLSEKIHSGTVFCIEKTGDGVYTGSRDHTVKCYADGFTTLSPPHLDSVQGLVGYKGDLISLGRDCSLKRWRGTSIIKTVPYAHDSWIKCGTAMKDSFVTGSKNGTLRFWDFSDNSVFCVGKLKVGGSVNCILYGGSSAYAGCQSKEIVVIKCNYDT